MNLKTRALLLVVLPLSSFGFGALGGEVAARVAKSLAPEAATLMDAVVLGQEEAIFRLVSAGEDPGVPMVLKTPVFHWRRGDTTTPLLAAIAEGELEQVAFMLKNTRPLADPPNDLALCVAARYGHANVARFLMKMGARAVPKNGCGETWRPEDLAAKYGSSGLSRELQGYRIEAAVGPKSETAR